MRTVRLAARGVTIRWSARGVSGLPAQRGQPVLRLGSGGGLHDVPDKNSVVMKMQTSVSILNASWYNIRIM